MNLKLDRLRQFGQICPPEQLTCFDGKSIATAMRDKDEGEPEAYALFIANAGGKHHSKTRCYEQDGFSYDAEGDLIMEALDPEAMKRAKRAEAEAAARRVAAVAYAAAMADAGMGETPTMGERPLMPAAMPTGPITATDVGTLAGDGAEGFENPEGAKLDLLAYFRGEVAGVPWFAVAKAIRDQHGISAKDKAEAREKLIEARILPMMV